jgi:hypothetical protein
MSPVLLAIMLLAGSRSAERLDAVFDAADRVTVVEMDVVQEPHGRYGRQVERIVYDSSSAADVEALRSALREAAGRDLRLHRLHRDPRVPRKRSTGRPPVPRPDDEG